jgi:hypothetical protein
MGIRITSRLAPKKCPIFNRKRDSHASPDKTYGADQNPAAIIGAHDGPQWLFLLLWEYRERSEALRQGATAACGRSVEVVFDQRVGEGAQVRIILEAPTT